MPGKLPHVLLERTFLKNLGINDPSVIVKAMIGGDAGVVNINNQTVLVAHTDPITSAQENVGWLSIHVSANDVAAIGARPRWFLTTVLLPEGTREETISRISEQVNQALNELKASLIGGHTEYTEGINKIIVVTTALGIGRLDELTPAYAARPGDYILMTKYAAIEATAIAANELKTFLKNAGLNDDELAKAGDLIKNVSIVPEATLLSSLRLSNGMHDPTEGGIVASAYEMSYASGYEIEIFENKIPVLPVTIKIFKALGIDPLKSLSSGALLASVSPYKINEAVRVLKEAGINCSIIGRVLNSKGKKLILKRSDGNIEEYKELVQDSYVSALRNLNQY